MHSECVCSACSYVKLDSAFSYHILDNNGKIFAKVECRGFFYMIVLSFDLTFPTRGSVTSGDSDDSGPPSSFLSEILSRLSWVCFTR